MYLFPWKMCQVVSQIVVFFACPILGLIKKVFMDIVSIFVLSEICFIILHPIFGNSIRFTPHHYTNDYLQTSFALYCVIYRHRLHYTDCDNETTSTRVISVAWVILKTIAFPSLHLRLLQDNVVSHQSTQIHSYIDTIVIVRRYWH